MAVLSLLHKSQLDDFTTWLEQQGYMIISTSKNPYEVLRARKGKDIVILYSRNNNKEHLSVMDKDYPLIGRYLRERKGQKSTNIECVSEQKSTNAELIRSMNDEELANLLSQTSKVIPDTYDSILEWLKSESDVAVSELCNFDVRR